MKTLEEIEALVGALPAATLPMALLPVQVQTRYTETELLVRVYPDELHLDGHDERLTAAEVTWGRAYWELIWPAPKDTAAQGRAWEQLVSRFGSRRAAWVVLRTTPSNLSQRPGTPPAFPDLGTPRDADVVEAMAARLLPDRWIVAGYRGGRRVLFEAGEPVPAELPVGPGSGEPPGEAPRDDTLALDERMAWMVDFEAAERVGMGIRAPIAGATRLDTLLVFGISGLAAEAGAQALESMLDAHHYTRGLAFLARGTPTNNTAQERSSFTRGEPDAAASFEVEIRPPKPKAGADGLLAARLLGIKRELFAAVEGSARTDDLDARHMQTVLWPVTGGYYLEQLLELDHPQLDAARRFFLDFVRHQGPLPTLRVGRQPYGLLPAMSIDGLEPDRFVRGLLTLRAAWRSAAARVPRLTPGDQDENDLVELLRMQPTAAGFRVRLAIEREFFAHGGALPGDFERDVRSHGVLLRSRLEQLEAAALLREERVLEVLPSELTRQIAAPLVHEGELSPREYLAFLRTAPYADVLADRLPAGAAPRVLLYALLRHSVLLAQALTAHRILGRRGALPRGRYREPVLVDILGSPLPQRSGTLPRIVESDPALRDLLHTLTAAQEPEAAALEELRASLAHLEAVPGDALGEQMSGCLDLFAYRLDAWITALATRRLHELRRQTARGLVIGGFGWVHDLRPVSRPLVPTPPEDEDEGPLFAAAEKGGAIHAPSLAHASAAAVLRSGHLAERGENGDRPFAIDLRSDRVRLAEWLLDGVREGQPLGALLGQRFERALHDRQFDRFIPGFRRVSLLADAYRADDRRRAAMSLPPGLERTAALRAAQAALTGALTALRTRFEWPATAGLDALEALAEARVADGLALARLFQGGGFPFSRVAATIPTGDRQRLETELGALQEALDAFGDALTAEGVYQLVRGNPERAAASVDSVIRGDLPPPELQVNQTPRPGTAQTHRLLVLFSRPAAAAAAPRPAAEPALDAWLKQMVGDIGRVRYRSEFVGADGQVLLARNETGVGGLSHLDVLHLAGGDLERLLAYRLLRGAPASIPPDARVRVLAERPPGVAAAQLSLRELIELMAAFREAILSARPVDGRDLAAPEPGLDGTEFDTRADRAVQALTGARAALAAASTDDAQRDRLAELVLFGFADAVPRSARGADDGGLAAQATAMLAEADRRLAAAQGTAHERLQAIFGPAFRALPLVRPANAAELADAFRRSAAAQGGDELQALSWLQAAGRVRAGAARLVVALTYAGGLGRATDLRVAQLPFRAGERWMALPGEHAPGKVSLVAHLPRTFRADAPVSGLLVDEWVEAVPAKEVTTGLAFNYESPAARPSQSVLLAVTPPGAARWDVVTLEKTLLETLDLARVRAADPQSLAEDALVHRALPAIYLSLNLRGEALSTNFSRLARF